MMKKIIIFIVLILFGSSLTATSADLTAADLDSADYSAGACGAMGVRANVRNLVPQVEYFRCVVSKLADAGLLEGLDEDGVSYVDLVVGDEHNRLKVSISDGSATADMCTYTSGETPAENTQIYFEEDSVGNYYISGTTLRPNTEYDVANGIRVYASADERNPNEITYEYIQHTYNSSTDGDSKCAGISGDSLDQTVTDNRCFNRYEGVIKNITLSGDEYSLINGVFAEKLPDESPVDGTDSGWMAGGSSAAIFHDGVALSAYNAIEGPDSFVLGSDSEETSVWTTTGLTAPATDPDWTTNEAVLEFLVLPERTATIPDIDNAWDCNAPTDVEFTVIDMTDSNTIDISSCEAKLETANNLTASGDLTTCSMNLGNNGWDDATEELVYKKQIMTYLCDEDDPLTSSTGFNCSTTISLAGIAVDPYIEGAVFCVDEDLSGTCDDGEPTSSASDAEGNFSFEFDEPLSENAVIIADPDTLGTHNGTDYDLIMSALVEAAIEENTTDFVVSPMTTMQGATATFNQDLTLADTLTRAEIAEMLSAAGLTGITADHINADPMVAIAELNSDSITDTALLGIRAALASYGFMRLLDASDELSNLTPDEIYTLGMADGSGADPAGSIYLALNAMVTAVASSVSEELIKNSNDQISVANEALATNNIEVTLPDLTPTVIIKSGVTIINKVVDEAVTVLNDTNSIPSFNDRFAKALQEAESVLETESLVSNMGLMYYGAENDFTSNETTLLTGAAAALTQDTMAAMLTTIVNGSECTSGYFEVDDSSEISCIE